MGRNLVKFKKIADIISNPKVDVMIAILMSRQLKKWKIFIVSLYLGG